MGAANAMTRQFDAGCVPPGGILMAKSLDRHDHNDDEREVIHNHDAFFAAKNENTDAKEASARHDHKADDSARGDGEEIRDIQTPRPSARRTSARSARGKRDTGAAKVESSIIQFSDHTARNAQQPTDNTEDLSAIRELDELKAQGFTVDEAIRLIHVSDRLANGREARESQTTLRRLRFTRWLIEHGVLDEFTA